MSPTNSNNRKSRQSRQSRSKSKPSASQRQANSPEQEVPEQIVSDRQDYQDEQAFNQQMDEEEEQQ